MYEKQMKTSDFFYHLPEELIAQHPADPRDSSRLMVYDRKLDKVTHTVFSQVTDFLRPDDLLVVNNTRVLPARLEGVRKDTGGKMEFLLLKRLDRDRWEVMVKPGRRARAGAEFVFSDQLSAVVEQSTDFGGRVVRFRYEGVFEDLLSQVGTMPLPHYIHEKLTDGERYQTVYAKVDGSAAAPTAGLHFTPELLKKIEALGVERAEVLLHVGLGTFRPVKAEEITDHKMHSEHYEISPEAAEQINRAKAAGRRVVAVGTTSVRTLESAADERGMVSPCRAETSIFIYPGYRFKCVDALITNFHLPESTLIMLVAALTGREKILELYDLAVRERYRFFSFGDAMLIV